MSNSNDVKGGLRLLQVIASELSRVMLIAIEVAVEFWLALTWSPQAQWLSEVSKSGVIQDEVIESGHQPTPASGCALAPQDVVAIVFVLVLGRSIALMCREEWVGCR